jgi:hypothetical protein
VAPTCDATCGGLATLRAGYACSQMKLAFQITDLPKQFLVGYIQIANLPRPDSKPISVTLVLEGHGM